MLPVDCILHSRLLLRSHLHIIGHIRVRVVILRSVFRLGNALKHLHDCSELDVLLGGHRLEQWLTNAQVIEDCLGVQLQVTIHVPSVHGIKESNL